MSRNLERYNKYFKKGIHKELFVGKVLIRETLFTKSISGLMPYKTAVKVGDKIKPLSGKPIIKNNTYYIPIEYKSKEVYINVNNIATPQSQNTSESLNIQASNLVRSGNKAKNDVILWGKLHPKTEFREFTSANELALSIYNGFVSNSSVPLHVVASMNRLLFSGKYSEFDWGDITNQSHKNQIGKYYGELLVGLCLLKLNREHKVFHGDVNKMLGGSKIISFLVPISKTFLVADSLIRTDMGIIPISSKKGGGTGASFYTNLAPLLSNMSDKQLESDSGLLIQMRDIFNKVNNEHDVMGQIYEWGFTYLLNKVKVKSDPKQIYKELSSYNGKGNDNYSKDTIAIIKYIRDTKFPMISSNFESNVKKNLPHSLTHLFLYHLSDILTSDEKAKDIILTMLGAKSYWQMDLQNKDWDDGKAVFNLKEAGLSELHFSPTRAGIRDIKSGHAKLNYILK